MLVRALRWLSRCLLASAVGLIAAGFLTFSFDPLIWQTLYRNASTYLPRLQFELTYHTQILSVEGFLLGLIPAVRLQQAVHASFARFGPTRPSLPEMDWRRPVLWAWAPYALLLIVRLLTFNARADVSVLGETRYSETRLEHFFGPLSSFQFSTAGATLVLDRFLLVGPAFFLAAYALGVWIRHSLPPQAPQQRLPDDTQHVEPH